METQPKVSIIVPVYNVENYLEECLDSLANQTLKEIEVIMVNDGSTDSSGEIMDRYAAKYGNFKAYHKENGGLGHARNYGVPFTTGEYIAFVDSDDFVSRDAYRLMYETARKTGSDLVIGNVKRFNSQKEFASGLHRKVFRETILKTHITKNPELVYDTTAWNKLFKKSFWDKYQFKFPEGILYEDIPVTIPAHFLSSSTDVLEDIIYYWRARDIGDKSITQLRNQLNNFTDRMKVIRMVDEFFEKHDIPVELREQKMYKDLSLDILLYLDTLDEVDDHFIQVFFDEVNHYLLNVPDHIFNQLNAIDRVKYYFVKQREKEKLLNVLEFQKNKMKTTKVVKEGNNYYGNYPYRSELPKELFIMNDEFAVVRKMESVTWSGSKLAIKGYNYISKLDMKKRNKVSLDAFLLNPDTGAKVPIPVEMVKRPDITFKKGVRVSQRRPLKRLYNYDWSGFQLIIDFADPQVKELGNGKLQLWFHLKVDNIEREFRAGGPVKGRKPRPSYDTRTGRNIYPRYNQGWDFFIDTNELSSVIDEVVIRGKDLIIKGQTIFDLQQAHLSLVNFSRGLEKEFSLIETEVEKHQIDLKENQFETRIPIEDIYDEDEENKWICYMNAENGQKPLIALQHIKNKSAPVRSRELRSTVNKEGYLQISFNEISPYLEHLHFESNQLSLSLRIYEKFFEGFQHIDELKLYCQHAGTGKVYEIPIETRKEKDYRYYTGKLPVTDDQGLAIFDPGIWRLYLEASGVYEQEYQVFKKSIRLDDKFKDFEENISSGIKLIPYRTKANHLSIKSVLYWDWIERGPRRQEVIKKVLYPLFRLLPMKKKTVVFEAYWGRSYSCNPRAIYEQMLKDNLDYEYVWFFNNENTPIQGNGKQIRINSWKYFYYLATAKYFINNANFPDFYEKRKGAVEIQTLHGTPLKTMGIDVPGEVDTEDKLNRFLRRCGRWDYLISPSTYVTGLSRRCFVYKKEMLEVGFPRNDKLFYDNNEEQIRELKEKIGIPLDKKVILYAPTWRVKKSFKLQLELDKMQEELGDEYIVLLRLHYFVARSVDVSQYKGFVYNLSSYEDIQDLYLLADLLITDYSSVMFDYAILNRPILFFTYDLELYRDQLRGMYVDFEGEAPGPLARTTDELIESIKDLEHYWKQYGGKMRDFRSKFCEFDDGHASENVIKRVFRE